MWNTDLRIMGGSKRAYIYVEVKTIHSSGLSLIKICRGLFSRSYIYLLIPFFIWIKSNWLVWLIESYETFYRWPSDARHPSALVVFTFSELAFFIFNHNARTTVYIIFICL